MVMGDGGSYAEDLGLRINGGGRGLGALVTETGRLCIPLRPC